MFAPMLPLLALLPFVPMSDREPTCRAQDPQENRLIETLVEAQTRLEAVTSRLKVAGNAVCSRYGSRIFPTPLQVHLQFAAADGRVVLDLDGNDLDQGGVPDPILGLPRTQLSRLCLPGGMVETLDAKAGSITYTQLRFSEPRSMFSQLSPGELVWSFASTMRSTILARRTLRVAGIEGAEPERIVALEATSADGQQICRFECVEAWGWLPRRVESRNLDNGILRTTYLVEVQSVHQARLCAFPATARITRDPAGRGDPETVVELSYDPPVFDGVCVPTTLNAADSDAAGTVNGDPLYGQASFMSHSRLWDRGRQIEDLFAQSPASATALTNPQPGRLRLLTALSSWLTILLALSAGTALVALRRIRTRMSLGCALVAAACLALLAFERWHSPTTAAADPHMLVAADPQLKSRYLCGVDALYALTRTAGHESSYLRLLRMVRPGHSGTDMDTLRRVAEAIDLPVSVEHANDYDLPPSPAIAHATGDHFVVIAGTVDQSIVVFDPGIGLVAHDWASFRQTISAPLLVLHPVKES